MDEHSGQVKVKEIKMHAQVWIAAVLFILLAISTATAQESREFGMLMEASGDVWILRGNENFSGDLGANVFSGDTIRVGQNSKIVIISYGDCLEWSLTGSESFSVKTGSGITIKDNNIEPVRQLPVCYSPKDFEGSDSFSPCGFVLRGDPTGSVDLLRKEFESGNVSSSTLLTLLMHELSNGNKESAKPYFDSLKKQEPESGFVQKIANEFEK